MKEGCIWSLDKITCQTERTKILKACGNGQGGTMDNNCMAWRLDPNGKDGGVLPSSTATATAAPTPTMLTCKPTGYNMIKIFTCGCNARGACSLCNDILGFDLAYENEQDTLEIQCMAMIREENDQKARIVDAAIISDGGM
jgi:hypothetical protein